MSYKWTVMGADNSLIMRGEGQNFLEAQSLADKFLNKNPGSRGIIESGHARRWKAEHGEKIDWKRL